MALLLSITRIDTTSGKMGYTYLTESKRLTICSYTGLTIVNLYHQSDSEKGTPYPYDSLAWQEGTLVARDGSQIKTYRVRFAESPDPKYRLLMRTLEVYPDAKFEEIFHLGCGGKGYTEQITQGITQHQKGMVEWVAE